ncbi:MAG: hypothetical protein AB1325_02905 [Nitrospirota bacterium]
MKANKLIITIAFLLVSSLLIILSEWHLWRNYESVKMKAFQGYVCGLGLGAAVNPAWGFINYDARIDSVDETQLWPIPGGYSYSPDRGLSVSDFRELAFEVSRK